MILFNQSVINSFSGAFGNHFDSFVRMQTGRYITIFKEPIKRIITSDSNMMAGYSMPNTESTYELIPVSGVFPATIVYQKKENEDAYSKDIGTTFVDNLLQIKVEKDAADFIRAGKVQNVLLDGQTFNNVSQYKVQNYLGLQYYYFTLSQSF